MSAKRAWLAVLTAIALLVIAGGGAGLAAKPVAAPVAGSPVDPSTSTAPAWVPPMTAAVQVTGTGHDAKWADVAYNATSDEYLVVWKGAKSIWGRRVSSRGEPLGAVFEIASGPTLGDGRPRVAYDASRNRYLVVWGRASGSNYQMHGRFIGSTGPQPALTAFAIDNGNPAVSDEYAVAHALTQDEFLVVWAAKPLATGPVWTVGRRIKADGSGFPYGTFWITKHASDNRGNPDVAYNLDRNQYLVTVDDYPKVNDNVHGVRLAGHGGVLGGGEFTIAGWPGEENYPAVAACPTEDLYLVAWHGIQNPTDGVYAMPVSGDGKPGDVKELVRYDWWSHHYPLDVACGATGLLMEDPHFLVTWSTGLDLSNSTYAREVSSSGTLSDRFEIARWSGPPAVAGGKINHLVAWETQGSDYDNYTDIYARIVGNTRPKAAFSVNPTEGDSTTVFQFDASACSDATDAKNKLAVRWDWDHDGVYDTTWSQAKIAVHKFSLAASQSVAAYHVQMEVTDGHGESDATTRPVVVHNAPPTARFTVDPASGDTNTSFRFDASNSSDPEGGDLTVRWDWEDDGAYDTPWGATQTANHTFPTKGTHVVRLEVRDGSGLTDAATHQVTVGGATVGHLVYVPLILRNSP